MIRRFSALLAGAISAPIYMAYLGAESFGIVGIYLAFFAFLSLFDFGLPVSANRQISLMHSKHEPQKNILSVIRAYELVIYSIATFGAIILIIGAPYVSNNWLNNETISNTVIEEALVLAAVAAAMRFPVAFYNNVLFASERHLSANIVTALFAILRVLVTVAMLAFYHNDLETFFYSQIYLNLGEVLCLFFLIWKKKFSLLFSAPNWSAIKKNLSLTISLTGISITALVQSQIDKILLSKWLSLSEFGLYSLAYTLAMGVLPIAYAISNATFPKLTRIIDTGNIKETSNLLTKANFYATLLIVPISVTAAFSPELLKLITAFFTDSNELVTKLLVLMLIGACFQSSIVLPHQYRVAQHKASLIFYINLLCIPIYLALIYYLALKSGVLGAALAFLIINAINLSFHYITLAKAGDYVLWGTIIKNNIYLVIGALALYFLGNTITNPALEIAILKAAITVLIIFILILLIHKKTFIRKA